MLVIFCHLIRIMHSYNSRSSKRLLIGVLLKKVLPRSEDERDVKTPVSTDELASSLTVVSLKQSLTPQPG